MLIGVVSDTHGYLDPRLIDAFAGVEAILHAGDVGSDAVIEGLRELAPLYAVAGNNDIPLCNLGLPHTLDVELAGVALHLVHELPQAQPSAATRVVVFGHSHRQRNEWRDGMLYLNPGAAGRRGFHATQTAALLRIDGTSVEAEAVLLGPRLKLPSRR